MVKIKNVHGDEYRGKQAGAVYQGFYGRQVRRLWDGRKENKAPGQEEQKRRFRVGLAWYKGLSSAELAGLKEWLKNAGIRLTAQQYAIKTALDRGRVNKVFFSETSKEWAYISGWDAEGWAYRQVITITNSNSYDLTDFSVKLELTADNVGANFDWSRQGADLRFYDEAGNKLGYWVESWDEVNKQAVVWVKVLSIAANSSTTIKMYYGNTVATSESNGDAVFEFFDDFNGTSLDTNKWTTNTISGTVSVSSGTVTLDTGSDEGYAEIKANYNTSTDLPVVIEARLGVSSAYDGTDNNRVRFNKAYAPFDIGIFDDSSNTVIQVFWNGYTGVGVDLDTYIIARQIYETNTVVWGIYREDGSKIYENSYTPSSTPDGVFYSVGDDVGANYGKITIDWVRVRKYADVEPSAVFGSEEYGLVFTEVVVSREHVIIRHAGIKSIRLYDDSGTLIDTIDNLSDLASAKVCTIYDYEPEQGTTVSRVVIESISGVLNPLSI